MGRGSPDLMTCWIPFGDIPVEQGTLMVCPTTHKKNKFKTLQSAYGKLDVDRDVPNDPNASGHLTNHPLTWAPKKGHKIFWDAKKVKNSVPQTDRDVWLTEDFRMGDVVIFGMKTLHMSTTNTTG